MAVSNGLEAQHNSWDGSYFATTRVASKRAYQEAGIDRPREQLSLIEVHDCFLGDRACHDGGPVHLIRRRRHQGRA